MYHNNKGPYGSSWTGPDMTKSGLLVQFRTFRVQKLYFDQISQWFCIIFVGEAQKSRYFDTNLYIWPNIPKIPEKSRKFLGIPRDLCGDLCGDIWLHIRLNMGQIWAFMSPYQPGSRSSLERVGPSGRYILFWIWYSLKWAYQWVND